LVDAAQSGYIAGALIGQNKNKNVDLEAWRGKDDKTVLKSD
jgi:hypothetical protein